MGLKNKLIKLSKYLFILSFFIISFFCYGQQIYAGPLDVNSRLEMFKQDSVFLKTSGYDPSGDISNIVAQVIKGFLSLLGIIFVVLIVIAGNKWMNARGNEEKVEEAQDTIRRAIIGLIITVSAYAITYFVFSNLP